MSVQPLQDEAAAAAAAELCTDDKRCMVRRHHTGTPEKSPGSSFPSLTLSLSLSFSRPGVEKEHKTFLLRRATAFKLKLRVCAVLMTQRPADISVFSACFLSVCDHLQARPLRNAPASCGLGSR